MGGGALTYLADALTGGEAVCVCVFCVCGAARGHACHAGCTSLYEASLGSTWAAGPRLPEAQQLPEVLPGTQLISGDLHSIHG